MRKWIVFLISVCMMVVFSDHAWGQGDENPPEPMMQSTLSIPPPPGLPIDDYLWPLFLCGAALGGYSIMKLQKRVGN